MAWYLAGYSEKGQTKRYSYGYRRFSLLGAFINAVVLIVGSLYILSEAIPRLLNPEHSSAPGMIVFALVGIAVNGVAALRLKNDQTMNAQVVACHLLEDVLGWVVVLVVGLTLVFVDIHVLDPILSILITLYVLYNVISKLKKTVELFLQATPTSIDLDAIVQKLEAVPGVKSSHHTHLWSLDGEHNVLSTHLVVDERTSREEVMRVKATSKATVNDLNLEHLTIEIEYGDKDCTLEHRGEAK
ncbi:MAG: cation transporter [Anaerolineae bacterium]|nr:cation transporter [Anaerolineae bacterium]